MISDAILKFLRKNRLVGCGCKELKYNENCEECFFSKIAYTDGYYCDIFGDIPFGIECELSTTEQMKQLKKFEYRLFGIDEDIVH